MTFLALRWQAARDFLHHYGRVFGHAWRVRKQLDAPPRLAHEAAFLPAALELQETPVSPAPRVTMWVLMGFAFAALVWAVFGHIDVVATARGKIVPNDRSKVIQPLEAATVRAIHVSDGKHVQAGEVLIELDATLAQADSTRAGNDALAARLQVARARALLAALERGSAPLLRPLPDVATDRMAQEQRLLDGQFAEYQTKLARIDADIARREHELTSTREVVAKLEQTVPIVRQRARDYQDLVERNFVSRHGYLEKEQVRIEQEADLAQQRSRLKELEAALREGRGQRAAHIAETRRGVLDALHDAELRTVTTSQEVVKTDSRSRQMRLTAPVAGYVQQLAVHTVGGVVTPAQALMVVVPQDEALEVEAFLENKDIGFVQPGQAVEIKVETFPYTRYGTVHARVVHVSNDAINDEKKGLIYSARVRLDASTMHIDERIVHLSPGMAVTAEIKTGRRRVIEYFLAPLLQYQNESLRER